MKHFIIEGTIINTNLNNKFPDECLVNNKNVSY